MTTELLEENSFKKLACCLPWGFLCWFLSWVHIFLSELINNSTLLLAKLSTVHVQLDAGTTWPHLLISGCWVSLSFFHSHIYQSLHSLSESPSHATSVLLWGSWPSSFPLWNGFHTHSDFSGMWMKLLRWVVFFNLSIITHTIIWQSCHMHICTCRHICKNHQIWSLQQCIMYWESFPQSSK